MNHDVARGRLGATGSDAAAGATPGKSTRSQALPATAVVQRQVAHPVVQRQESGGVCLDPEAVLADLQRIAREAARVDPDPAVQQTNLRELARQAEVLRPAVDGCGVREWIGPLRAQLRTTLDAITAGYQGLVVHHADATLQAWDAAGADARDDQRVQWERETGNAYASSVTQDWCGKFANAQYRAAGMSGALRMSFNHCDNVAHFFSYAADPRSPARIRPHGAGPEEGVDLRAYHTQRGSLRSWLTGDAIGDDIRAGDVVTLDWANDGQADHIVIVASYTKPYPKHPGVLITIDGNAYGARKPTDAAPAYDGAEGANTTLGDMTTNDVGTSRWETIDGQDNRMQREDMIPAGVGAYRETTLYGRGRPSLVDFEPDHVYPDEPQVIEPTGSIGTIQQ